jgi:hypothetical protein
VSTWWLSNWWSESMGSILIRGRGCDARKFLISLDERNAEPHFHELDPAGRVVAAG